MYQYVAYLKPLELKLYLDLSLHWQVDGGGNNNSTAEGCAK